MNPFDQFDAPQQGSAGDNPFDQFDAPKALKPKVDMFDTVSDQGLQGATFGLGNRAQAGLAALWASGINGKPIGDNYKTARDVETARLSEEAAQNPKTALAANIAGAVGTGGLSSGTKTGAAVADWLGSGGTAARIGKGALSGGVSGAAYGGGAAGYGKTLEGAEKGAISGALVGGTIPAVGAVASDVYNTGKNALQGALADSPEAVQDAASAFKKSAAALYDQMRQIGATFKDSSIQGFLLPDVDKAVAKNNFIPALNPKTTAIIDDLKQRASTGSLGLDQLDQYRRQLGRIGASEDGVSAGAARRAIDDFVNSANASHLSNGSTQAISLLNQGRKQYAQASKFEDIADIVRGASGDPNKIKSALYRFWKNTDNTIGWTDAEKNTLKQAATSSGTEGILKGLGKFGIDLGTPVTYGNAVGPAVGYGISGGGAPVAGTIARYGQKLAARGKAQNLLDVLQGSAQGSMHGNAISPMLSAPAGAASGLLNNMKSRAPMRVTVPTNENLQNYQSLPEPKVNLPQVGDQSSLYDRVIHQESGGKQFNERGNPLVSSKGAVGVAQLMPATAKEAADAAGLPYDPRRLYVDQQYNAALGKAYLGKMQQKYGDDTTALIAYNWGPGNTDRWLKAGGDFNKLPSETKNYIKRILGA